MLVFLTVLFAEFPHPLFSVFQKWPTLDTPDAVMGGMKRRVFGGLLRLTFKQTSIAPSQSFQQKSSMQHNEITSQRHRWWDDIPLCADTTCGNPNQTSQRKSLHKRVYQQKNSSFWLTPKLFCACLEIIANIQRAKKHLIEKSNHEVNEPMGNSHVLVLWSTLLAETRLGSHSAVCQHTNCQVDQLESWFDARQVA